MKFIFNKQRLCIAITITTIATLIFLIGFFVGDYHATENINKEKDNGIIQFIEHEALLTD